MDQAVHVRIEPDAGIGITEPEQMHMAVPHLRRVDVRPHRLHDCIVRQARRQRPGQAGIVETFIGPETPGQPP